MGYYGTECPTCGGPAILFSFNISISCGACEEKAKQLGQAIAEKAAKELADELSVPAGSEQEKK